MEKNDVDLQLLHQAFTTFTDATKALEKSYQALEEKAARLSADLAIKNRELECTLQERKKAESYLKNILESLPCGVIVLNVSGEIAAVNRTLVEIIGYSQEEINGDEAIKSKLRLADLQETSHLNKLEIPFLRKNGETLTLLFSVTRMDDVPDNSPGVVIIVQDVTEMRQLEEEAKRSSRILAMEEMATQIAENIRNPLGSLELFASLLRRELRGEGAAGRYADLISSGIRNLDNVVSNLLFFTYPIKPKFQTMDVCPILDQSLEFAQHLIKQNKIKVSKHYSSDRAIPASIRGDSELLKQLFLNLIINAVQAMPEGGKLVVSLWADGNGLVAPSGAKKKNPHFKRQSADDSAELHVAIQDSGCGISAEIKDKIFNPFFSTHEKNSGLGLTIAHNIVTAHHGWIDFRSDGAGTTFRVTFPLSENPKGGDER